MFKKILSKSLVTVVTLISIVYLVYILLLQDSFLHCSISSIIHYAHHLTITQHLLVLGLLPVYIAAIIFGVALISIYLGSKLQYFFNDSLKKPFPSEDQSQNQS